MFSSWASGFVKRTPPELEEVSDMEMLTQEMAELRRLTQTWNTHFNVRDPAKSGYILKKLNSDKTNSIAYSIIRICELSEKIQEEGGFGETKEDGCNASSIF